MTLITKPPIAKILEHPIVRALNPAGKHFMEVRWLSSKLNPGARYGLEVGALITKLPHIKTVPAFQMMLEDFQDGRFVGVTTIVVPSSGNTAHGVVRLAPAFGIQRVKVVLPSDITESKRGIIAALASASIIEPEGRRTTDEEAEELARMPGHYLLDQYKHDGNVRAHQLYTGPEIERACDDDVDIVAIAMGSGGTVTGVSRHLKREGRRRIVIGVRPVLGEQVPGARDERRMAQVVTLPWKRAVDAVAEGRRKASFIAMRQLWSEVEPQPGPSSGLAFVGLTRWLEGLDPTEREKLRGKRAVFLCPDDGRFYPERTTGELDPDQGLAY